MSSTNPEWDVYRDDQGNPVTINPEQLQAILRAIHVVHLVRAKESPDRTKHPMSITDYEKSRLLGRMLIDGRPPLDEKPPRSWGGPDYHSMEPDLDHFYLGMTPEIYSVGDSPIMIIDELSEN